MGYNPAMVLVLDIASSLEFWRQVYPTNRAPKAATQAVIGRCAHTVREIRELMPKWVTPEYLEALDGKLHVLTFDKNHRGQSANHVAHVWSSLLPENSFYDLGNHVYVASPEFVFLGAASLLAPAPLIALGDELCGVYGFNKAAERGFRSRAMSLTSTEKLRHYLKGAAGMSGVDKAERALQHVVDGSASPMETFDEMAMCLPYRLGGYCLPPFAMNYEVKLSPKAARIALRKTCYADMCRPEVPLDVEHHGKHDHSSPQDVASDRARVNALKEMGYEVVELTSEQVNDVEAFDYIVQRIAKLMGKRLDPTKLGKTPARLELHATLVRWNRTYGRIR